MLVAELLQVVQVVLVVTRSAFVPSMTVTQHKLMNRILNTL